MSQLDALLERSRAPGTFVEKRTFTLARSKAIEKMREFTLRHPRQYVLELVQAAVFAGARWIAVDVDRDHLVVAWVGGRLLTERELESLFDYLFADQGDASTRHLLQTAVGINAILQRKPRRIRIESGDGTVAGTARLDLDKRGDGQIGTPEAPLAGTYLYAEFTSSFLARFTGVDSFPQESQLVETRCLYTPTPILLNGSAPFGYRASREVQLFGVKRAVPVTSPQIRGALGLPEQGVKPGVRIVVGGVWIADRRLDELGPDLVGVVADDRLRKTADMSDIVEDARWIDLLHDVGPSATRLIRGVRGKAWQPPRLPARITEDAVPVGIDEPAPEPIPSPIQQLAPRSALPLGLLSLAPSDEPLFWVEPTVAEELTAACDPVRFPHRVLVLTAGQARSLAGRIDAAPSRLTTAEDVGFVRAALERRHGVHSVELDAEVPVGLGTAVHLRLELRLHLDGPDPRWDGPEAHRTGGVPLALVRGPMTRRLARLELPLHHVSVVARLPPLAHRRAIEPLDADAWTARLLGGISAIVQENAWRLLPDLASSMADDRRRKLELALLSDHARAHLLRATDGRLSLTAHLPSAWHAVGDALLDAPLAETTEGPLTLRRLIDLQVEERTLQLARLADRDLLEPLEARFGLGRLVVPEDLAAPIAIVGRIGQAWQHLGPAELASPMVTEVILAFPCRRVPDPPPDWRALSDVGPGIVHWWRARPGDGGSPPDPAASLVQAAPALLRQLHQLDAIDWKTRPRPQVVSAARARAAGRLAALHIATAARMLSEVRIVDSAGRAFPVTSALADPALCCAATGGATARDRHVFPVTLDEARALEAARASLGLAGPLPLLLDDHPDVWGAIDDDDDHWLVRVPVDHPGLRGWLALRLPWDPTPGVLLETATQLEVLRGLTARVPCHGLLHADSDDGLTEAQLELLHLAGLQLYRALLSTLADPSDDVRREAARRYATTFTTSAWRRAGHTLPRGLARHLAVLVPVDDAEGRPWGTLRDWLGADPAARPDPPPGVLDRSAEPAPVPALVEVDDETWSCLSAPIERALRVQGVGASVRFAEGAEDAAVDVDWGECTPALASLRLRRDELAERALGGDEVARGLLLVEATRHIGSWARTHRAPVDPFALQQTLLASRLARA